MQIILSRFVLIATIAPANIDAIRIALDLKYRSIFKTKNHQINQKTSLSKKSLECACGEIDHFSLEGEKNHPKIFNDVEQHTIQEDRPPLRTLLIDNYDSYTYNLYQQLAIINGEEPYICYNDDEGSNFHAILDKMGYIPDNIVISPGPGHPARKQDFGMCAQVLREAANIPILGVCLGHEGLGIVHGAEVCAAPTPMHGRISSVFHNNDPLFKGIEQGFKVVRYHSLAINPSSIALSSVLIPTAWSSDGVIMAIRHATKPHSGVQFHPESICTEKGSQIMKNFRDLSIKWNSQKSSRKNIQYKVATRRKIFGVNKIANASKISKKHRMVGVALNYHVDTENAFRSLFGTYSGSKWWLDSSSREQQLSNTDRGIGATNPAKARFSFMGAADSEIIEYYGDGLSFVTDQKGRRRVDDELMDILKKRMHYSTASSIDMKKDCQNLNKIDSNTLVSVKLGNLTGNILEWGDYEAANETLPFDFWGGYVGYFGYEMRHDTIRTVAGGRKERGKSNSNQRNIDLNQDIEAAVPIGFWMKVNRFIAFDHDEKRMYIMSIEKHNPDSAQSWVKDMVSRIKEIRLAEEDAIRRKNCIRLVENDIQDSTKSKTDTSSTCIANRSRIRYEYDLNRALDLIRQGETYEICLTNQIECNLNTDQSDDNGECPLDLYCRLRKSNPAPYAAFMMHDPANLFTKYSNFQTQGHGLAHPPSFAVCCSSPERFLRLDRHGVIESKPIKGTSPRGNTPEEDQRLLHELSVSKKAIAENLMITDLVRNDMGRICKIGSVHVPVLMAIESYATVHQMITTVRGKLRDELCALDAICAAFPPGSMTGAPKIRTMEIIDLLEDGVPRGIYSGCLGFLSYGGQMDLNVVIRTGILTPGKVTVGAGGAVIALSDIHEEYNEMLLKSRSVLRALGMDVAPCCTDST